MHPPHLRQQLPSPIVNANHFRGQVAPEAAALTAGFPWLGWLRGASTAAAAGTCCQAAFWCAVAAAARLLLLLPREVAHCAGNQFIPNKEV